MNVKIELARVEIHHGRDTIHYQRDSSSFPQGTKKYLHESYKIGASHSFLFFTHVKRLMRPLNIRSSASDEVCEL